VVSVAEAVVELVGSVDDAVEVVAFASAKSRALPTTVSFNSSADEAEAHGPAMTKARESGNKVPRRSSRLNLMVLPSI